MGSAICAPAPIQIIKRFFFCHRCKHKRLCEMKVFEWYEPHAVCLKCKTTILLMAKGYDGD
jgi:hypothetical protein